MLLVHDGLRGAVRIVLHRSATENAAARSLDGWVDLESGRRIRVEVTASPAISDPNGPADLFIVSFTECGDLVVPSESDIKDNDDETRRLRMELRRTIEELQTSNEELKASNEEVMSVNEELQSANEELETSKEEMQSLNEELNTVNSQLRVKVDEDKTTRNHRPPLLSESLLPF